LPVISVENGAMSKYSSSFTIPDELPVLPLREMVVFPYMVLPLFVARERSIAAVEDALAGDRLLLLVAQREGDIEAPEPDDLYRVGTVAMVMRILRMGDGRVKVLVQGLAKARIDRFVEHERASWVSVSAVPACAGGWRSCCPSRTCRPRCSRSRPTSRRWGAWPISWPRTCGCGSPKPRSYSRSSIPWRACGAWTRCCAGSSR